MYQLVCNEKYSRRLSYQKLLRYLHDISFTFTIDKDGNRAEDGTDLRYRFGYERGYDGSTISVLDDRVCSVLEMMVALSIRCEENIMIDSEIGDRTGQWFWNMIVTLGLGAMTDAKFDSRYTNEVIHRFLNREYKETGEGGLFSIKHCRYDLREVEIWYQMCWYLDSVA
jgi:hypothetical protein